MRNNFGQRIRSVQPTSGMTNDSPYDDSNGPSDHIMPRRPSILGSTLFDRPSDGPDDSCNAKSPMQAACKVSHCLCRALCITDAFFHRGPRPVRSRRNDGKINPGTVPLMAFMTQVIGNKSEDNVLRTSSNRVQYARPTRPPGPP